MELIRERLKIEEYNYPFADKVKSQLQSQITLLSASGPSNINAQFTGWELQGKEVDNIIKWISNLITKDFVPDGGFTLKCSELWGVLYKEGDYITEHDHSPSLYSFSYYVNVPKGSSPLVFVTSGRKIKPEEGKLVIFESRLLHKVPTNKCKDRCVISGNFIYNKEIGIYDK